MKKPDWLKLFAWPAFAVVVLLSLSVSPFLWSDKRTPPPRPVARAAVKYTLRNLTPPIVPEEIAEIRALYAPDLFASSRGSPFPASHSVTNRSEEKDAIPSENPLFLAFHPPSNVFGAQLSAITGWKTDNYGADLKFRFHSPRESSYGGKKPAGSLAAADSPPRRALKRPKISIELKGELKHFSFSPGIFQDIALSAGPKPWSVQAEMRVNNEGRVEHVFAEEKDCAPSVYREIVKKLYQCHFSNVNQTCEGMIIINYPVYFAEHPEKH